MEEISNTGKKGEINNNEEYLNSKKLLLELLNSYSYGDIMSCLINEQNGENDVSLEIKLKKLVDHVDIEQLANLLIDEEIIKYNNITKNKNNNNVDKIQSETAPSSLDRNLNIENNDIENNIINNKKEKKEPIPTINKVVYRKNDNNIYIYRYVSQKKGNIVY